MRTDLSQAVPVESAIQQRWNAAAPVAISVVCTTFNQAGYIEDAIRGFLVQETDVPFEILIHDDCSTDGTQAILARYQQQYPGIIRLILQEKNIYSQGISPWVECFKVARGAFIALCEGDDFWTQPGKLQQQYDLMMANGSLSFCCHNAQILQVESGELSDFNRRKPAGAVSMTDLVLKDWFIPTASVLFRKSALRAALPAWFHKVRSQDLALEIILASAGSGWYSEANHCIYRKNAIGSLSAAQSNPWAYLYKRIDLMGNLMAYLPARVAPLIGFDIVKSLAKIVYARLIFRKQPR